MAGQPVIAANAPVANPLEMMAQGYSPQTAVAAQHSQYLAQALAAMQQQGQNIRTPVALGADLLANALYQRRYGQSLQDFAKTAQADQAQIDAPLIQALHGLSGGQAPAQPTAPPAAPTSLTPDVNTPPPPPTPQNTVPAPSPTVLRAVLGEAGGNPEGQKAVYASILKRAQESGLTPEQVVTAPGQYEGLNAPWMHKVGDLTPYLQKTAANIAGVGPGQFDSFYSPSGQAALGRPAPEWAHGPGTNIGGNAFYQTGYQAPAGMTPSRAQTPGGQPSYAPQGQPGSLQIATNPQATTTQPPSPSAASSGGTASAPPAAASPAAGGASAPSFSNQPYIDPRRAGFIEAELQSPMTRMQGRADARALIQESMGGDQWDVKTDPTTGQTIYSSKTRPGVSFAMDTQNVRVNPTTSVQGSNLLSFDPRDPTHPTVTPTGLPTEIKPMMAPNGHGGYDAIPTPLGADKAFALQDQRLKSEGYQTWASSKEAFDAMKANAVQPGGMSGYALLDTFARTINPAGAVRLGTIKAIEEMQGIPEELKGMLNNIGGQGKISPQLAQQIINAALPFVQANYARAQREQTQAIGLAKAQGIDPRAVTLDLGEAPSPLDLSAPGGGRPSIYDTNASPVPHPGPQHAQGAGGWQVMGVSH